MTGWTQFGLIVWLPVAAVLAVTGGFVWLVLAAVRHFVRWGLDERDDVRDQRRTTPPPEHCWVSPDEELEFEEIVGPLRPARHTGEVPPC